MLAGLVPRPEPATVVVPNPTAPGKTGRAEDCACASIDCSANTAATIAAGVDRADRIMKRDPSAKRFFLNELIEVKLKTIHHRKTKKVQSETNQEFPGNFPGSKPRYHQACAGCGILIPLPTLTIGEREGQRDAFKKTP